MPKLVYKTERPKRVYLSLTRYEHEALRWYAAHINRDLVEIVRNAMGDVINRADIEYRRDAMERATEAKTNGRSGQGN